MTNQKTARARNLSLVGAGQGALSAVCGAHASDELHSVVRCHSGVLPAVMTWVRFHCGSDAVVDPVAAVRASVEVAVIFRALNRVC